MSDDDAYLLGTDEHELARLRTQDGYWAAATEAFLDRVGVSAGQVVVDAGCGPGFVSERLAARVGPAGRVLAVDASPRFGERVQQLPGVEFAQSRLEDLELPDASVDLVFARWVFSFLPDPAAILARLACALRPGGVIAIQDYNHEGVSLFPRSAGFEAAIRATRAFYASAGGDTWIATRLPRLLADAGLQLVDEHAHLLSGGPDSPAFRWVGEFMPRFTHTYLERGLMTAAEHAAFHREWAERSADPHARFYTPTVVDLAARKP